MHINWKINERRRFFSRYFPIWSIKKHVYIAAEKLMFPFCTSHSGGINVYWMLYTGSLTTFNPRIIGMDKVACLKYQKMLCFAFKLDSIHSQSSRRSQKVATKKLCLRLICIYTISILLNRKRICFAICFCKNELLF